jgi:hypothetical protein
MPKVLVSVPDTSASPGNTIRVPVVLSDVTGKSVMSAEFTLTYNPQIISAIGAIIDSTTLPWSVDWSSEWNTIDGEIHVALAGPYALEGEGNLVYINFLVADVETTSVCTLHFDNFLFNEGDLLATTTDGNFSVIGEPDIAVSPDSLYFYVDTINAPADTESMWVKNIGTLDLNVIPGGSQEVVVAVNSEGLPNDTTCYDILHIISNDPDTPDYPVPVVFVMNIVGIEEEDASIPTSFGLAQSYPNPTAGKSVIKYQLSRESEVSLKVYNCVGQLVRTLAQGTENAGYKKIVWNGRDEKGAKVAPGIFFYRIEAGEYIETKKLAVLR